MRRASSRRRTAMSKSRCCSAWACRPTAPRRSCRSTTAISALRSTASNATMPDTALLSRMGAEIAEIPAAAERLLQARADIDAIARKIELADPSFVVFCGRGSSGHVGVYLRYLFENKLGLLVSAAAPSVVTAYKSRPAMQNVLFIVISQSGRSPDLIAATQAARSLGALTLAIVNHADSPAAEAAEL